MKPRPQPSVVKWFDEAEEDELFLSVASLAEIRRGTEQLPDGRRRRALADWLSRDLTTRFEGRILTVDRAVAETAGVLVASGHQAGRTVQAMDAFIAATAVEHGLTLVTRNVKDFEGLGVDILNLWTDAYTE